jgi:segregation and condensation protein B
MSNLPTDSAPEQSELPVSEAAADPAALARLERILEALLLSADQPLSLDQLHRLLGPELGVTKKDLRAALEQLSARITGGACELTEVASGFRIQVRSEYAEWVGRLWQEKPPKYSRALLETLALIAYRQPITRGEIEDIRGVAVSTNILRTLLERGWIRELGYKEVPGRPALFGTTPQFLDDFNLRSLDQLPALPEIKDMDQLENALARLADAAPLAAPDEREALEPEAADESASAPTPDDGDSAAPTVH